MEEKLKYENAKIDLILIASKDVIATSEPLGDGGFDYDNNAWA